MPASALLIGASVASLNLCTDEYLLLLARPDEIASVSYLSRDPLESRLWRLAGRHHSNRGSIEHVLARRPDVVLTMGGGGRATALIGKRLKLRVVDLPYAASPADVAVNLRKVAAALSEPSRAEPWVRRLRALEASAPAQTTDAIYLSGSGETLASGSAGAQWLRLAGLRQRPLPGGRVSLETILLKPPKVLVRSRYRTEQVSRGALWLRHPAVRRAKTRTVDTDGRAWTCYGPLLIPEIERLRKQAR